MLLFGVKDREVRDDMSDEGSDSVDDWDEDSEDEVADRELIRIYYDEAVKPNQAKGAKVSSSSSVAKHKSEKFPRDHVIKFPLQLENLLLMVLAHTKTS